MPRHASVPLLTPVMPLPRSARAGRRSLPRRRAWRSSVLASACLGCLAPALVWAQDNADQRKKLLAWGWDTTNIAQIRANISTIEQLPFDGLVLQNLPAIKNGQTVQFNWEAFGQTRFEHQDLTDTMAVIQTTNFRRLSDNFLHFNMAPTGGIDWFGDFDTILHNVALGAQVAREAGTKGWMFDVEDYKGNLFDYRYAPHHDQKTFNEYAAQVRLRGQQVMQSIQSEYPNIVLHLTLAHSYLYQKNPNAGQALPYMDYGLLPSFVDGLLSTAGPGVRIIDGNEASYGYLHPEDYSNGLNIIQDKAVALAAPDVQAKYRSNLDPGMAIYANYIFNQNLPDQQLVEQFHQNAYNALKTSSQYAWLYSEGMGWWEEGYPYPTPPGAVDALRSARAQVRGMEVAAHYAQDHFRGAAGAAADSTRWTAAAPGVRLDGQSRIVLDSGQAAPPAGAFLDAAGGGAGSHGFQATAESPGRFVALGVDMDETQGGVGRVGLSTDGSGDTEIMLRSSFSYGDWYLRVAQGNDEAIFLTDVNRFLPGDWVIDWSIDRIRAFFNGDLKIDTATTAPVAISSAGLVYPALSLAPSAGTGSGGVLRIDAIDFGAVASTALWIANSGDWNNPANWADGIAPNGINSTACFLNAIKGQQTVYTNAPIVVGTLRFENTHTYAIIGTASLTFQVSTGSALVSVAQGSHTINLPLFFASNTDLNISDRATLTLADPTTIRAGVTVTKSGDVLVQAPLKIEAGGTLVLASGLTQLSAAPRLSDGARIDLRTNSMVIRYGGQPSPASPILSQLIGGYAGGAWTGSGIMTSSATPATALGWEDDPATQSILVKYTYLGDTNLDGQVDVIDLGSLATAWQTTGVWASGDSNYDGFVDVIDLGLLAMNWQAGVGSPLGPGALEQALASYGLPTVAVPEPAAAMLLMSLSLLVGRCRRRLNFRPATIRL